MLYLLVYFKGTFKLYKNRNLHIPYVIIAMKVYNSKRSSFRKGHQNQIVGHNFVVEVSVKNSILLEGHHGKQI